MQIKSIFFIILVTLATLLASPYPVSAHVLKTDKDIGAVFHVTPDDDPIAGQESEFFFEIKDKTNKFSPDKCNCQVAIQQNGQTIFNQSIFHSQHSSDPSASGFTYTFPEKAIYTLIVTGNPSDGISFQPFTLTYDLRVDRQTQTTNNPATQPENPPLPLAYILLPIVLVSFLTIALLGKKKNGLPKNLLVIIFGLIISTAVLNTRPLLFIEPLHHDQTAIHHEQSHPCCIPQAIANAFSTNLNPEISYINNHTNEPEKIYHPAIKSLTKNKSPPAHS